MSARLRMIWWLLAGNRLRYGGAILALVLGSCAMYLVPLAPQIVIDGVLSSGDNAPSWVRRAVEMAGGRDYLRHNLWIAAAAVAVLSGLSGLFTYLRGRYSALAAQRIVRDVRDRLYDRLQNLPCSYHDVAETGDQVQRCTSDVDTLRQFLATQVVEIGRAALMLLVPIPLMLALDVRMTLVALAIVPPIVIFSATYFRRVQRLFKEVDESEGRMTSVLQENLTGIRVVRAFARQEYETQKFGERIREYRDREYEMFKLMARFWSVSDFMCMGQRALLVAVGGYWLAVGEVPVGTFYFFLAAVNMFIWPIRMMGRILTELGKATVSIERIGEILDHLVESEPAGVPLLPATVETEEELPGEIVFDDVSFAHGDVPVLRRVSFRARAGRTLALLGPSGAGKSTIVNLLLRFYDPDAGAIRIDGCDIATLGRKEVRSRIAVVMQEPFLYSKTVKENIRLGRSSARDDEISEAASVACVHDAIEEFDKGYETLVGERGVTLSGGQRQRVALARALLDDPAVLILDDALSAVDTATETMILDALKRRHRRHTTIVIAHRLSTLMHADRILVLDSGRVIEEGTHETLSVANGLYRRLWEIQTLLEEDVKHDMETASRGVTGT